MGREKQIDAMWQSGDHFYLSMIRGAKATAQDGSVLGIVRDLVVAIEESGHPSVRGLIVRSANQDCFVPAKAVASLDNNGVRLRALEEAEYHRRNGDILAYQDLLDRQIVDARGARVFRVNDALIAKVKNKLSLVGIDVSIRGLLRRLGPRWLVGHLDGEIIDWAGVEPLAAEIPEVRLRFSHEKLARLHPADIGRIIDHLPYQHGAELIAALDDEKAADALEEVQKERQPEILNRIPSEKAVDILDKMAPDAAADLLDDLPRTKADRMIGDMEEAAAAEVRLLLSYPENSAGGLMTTDFVTVLEEDTTRKAVEFIRAQIEKTDLIYYLYVIDNPTDRCLRGVVSLRDLLLAQPEELLGTYMTSEVHAVHPEEHSDEVARIMRDYNLLALPVVDQAGRILGIVTVDDVLDAVVPEGLRRHLPRLFS